MIVPEIHVAGAGEHDKVIPQLALAFAADPAMRWFMPSAKEYLDKFERFALAVDGQAFESGTAHYTPDRLAGALWLPPRVRPDPEVVSETFSKLLRPETMEKVQAFGAELAKYRPKEPHWYLGYLGVDPSAQGRGLGAGLLRYQLRQCDKQGVPVFLESSNPRNVSLYERHGFVSMGQINVGNPEVMTPMFRAARNEKC